MGGTRWSTITACAGPFARVVHDEGVDERDVPERGIGVAGGRQPDALARQPLEGSVLPDVDDGVGTPRLVDPPVEGEVVVGRRKVGRVVDRDGVLAETAGGFYEHDDATEVDPREPQLVCGHPPRIEDAL